MSGSAKRSANGSARRIARRTGGGGRRAAASSIAVEAVAVAVAEAGAVDVAAAETAAAQAGPPAAVAAAGPAAGVVAAATPAAVVARVMGVVADPQLRVMLRKIRDPRRVTRMIEEEGRTRRSGTTGEGPVLASVHVASGGGTRIPSLWSLSCLWGSVRSPKKSC